MSDNGFPIPPSALFMDAAGVVLTVVGVLGLVTAVPARYVPALGEPLNCWILIGAGAMLMALAAWQIGTHLQRRKVQRSSREMSEPWTHR